MSLPAGSRILRFVSRKRYAPMATVFVACLALDGGRSGRFTVGSASEPAQGFVARQYVKTYLRPTTIPAPDDNPYTKARAALGKTLFFDPRLSGSERISCASCHNPALSWGDGLARAIGHDMKMLGRRTPTLVNLAWSESMFWDGRVDTLEEQALGPIQAPAEMNLDLDRMGREDQRDSRLPGILRPRVSGPAYRGDDGRAGTRTFERQIVSGTAPFDRWVSGDDRAMPGAAQRGFALFNTKAQCATCHSGWRFTDDSFHDIGVPGTDRGRGVILPASTPCSTRSRRRRCGTSRAARPTCMTDRSPRSQR